MSVDICDFNEFHTVLKMSCKITFLCRTPYKILLVCETVRVLLLKIQFSASHSLIRSCYKTLMARNVLYIDQKDTFGLYQCGRGLFYQLGNNNHFHILRQVRIHHFLFCQFVPKKLSDRFLQGQRMPVFSYCNLRKYQKRPRIWVTLKRGFNQNWGTISWRPFWLRH